MVVDDYRSGRSRMFGSMFETAAYHRGLQWPPTAAPSACGYTVPSFDPPAPSPRLTSVAVPDWHVPQSTVAAGYSGLGGDHARYAGTPLYDRRSAVRDVLFGCGRFSEPAGTSPSTLDDGRQQAPAAGAFSPLSLPCVGPDRATTSTGADCPPPPPAPRLPAAPYAYGSTPTDDRYYAGTTVNGPTAVLPPGDVQTAPAGGCAQSTAGFRSPALSLGFNTRRFVNDVIGQ